MRSYQICLPQSFTRPEELVTRSARHDEVLGEIDAPNTVKATDKGLSRRMIYACNDWADKIWTESLLV